jgi:hypothetical protein
MFNLDFFINLFSNSSKSKSCSAEFRFCCNIDHNKCHNCKANLCVNYHCVDKKIFDKDKYEKELILRLNYSILFGYLEEKTLINNTFLIDNKMDEGHILWIVFLIETLLLNKIEYVSKINLKETNKI